MNAAQFEKSFYLMYGSLGVRGVARAPLDRIGALLVLGACGANVPQHAIDVMLMSTLQHLTCTACLCYVVYCLLF